jgi:hypothetical protein
LGNFPQSPSQLRKKRAAIELRKAIVPLKNSKSQLKMSHEDLAHAKAYQEDPVVVVVQEVIDREGATTEY